ncbi:ribonucleoside diphosreductase [Escherichia coli]|nr:ribonucleoside diphosreductase [Escherichia coli]OKX46137.1 ribonucleoside diphosreductase [Escherichia coli]OKX73219.1 ribonucleoside diphosreductase [Escherichia coli]
MFSVPTTVAGCSVKRLIHPTVLCSGPVGPVGLIRRVSVASGTECRMRRERLIRPTVLCLDLVGLIRGVSVASGKKRQRTKQTQPHLASNL